MRSGLAVRTRDSVVMSTEIDPLLLSSRFTTWAVEKHAELLRIKQLFVVTARGNLPTLSAANAHASCHWTPCDQAASCKTFICLNSGSGWCVATHWCETNAALPML